MTRMIFVNLPVTDLPRAMAFYSALGSTSETRSTDPDGHIWEAMWMDPAVASGEAELPAVEA